METTTLVAMMPSEPTRIGLFVEGTNELTPGGRDDLAELWRGLAERVGGVPTRIDVHGFTKQQLVLLDPGSTIKVAFKLALDVHIERKHKLREFDRLVIAFDALPANQNVVSAGLGSCLATERDFLLSGLARSAILPQRFKASAAALLKHHSDNRGVARPRTQPPFGDVEVIYMEPDFESLVLTDPVAVRKVFSLSRAPNTWPKMPYLGKDPAVAFMRIVDAHRRNGPVYLRQPYKARKHAWAHEVVKHATVQSALFTHVIAERLRVLVLQREGNSPGR